MYRWQGYLLGRRGKRGADDAVLLAQVSRGIALAWTGAPRPAGIDERDLRIAQRRLEAMADRPPRAHVLRLLLRPRDLAQVRIRGHQPGVRVDRERIELLEPGDRD